MRLIDFLRDYREAVEDEKERKKNQKPPAKPQMRYRPKRHR